jgi:hypothetical protein
MGQLGFSPQEYRKSLYFDGHKRPDLVESQKKYIEDYDMYRKKSRTYGGDANNLDFAVGFNPKVLGDHKETVFIFHDESTIHAKEKPRLAWLLPGTSELCSKNKGRLIHISDFILESTGRLKLSEEQFQSCQASTGNKLASSDAATVIYPGSNGDKWWDMEQLCHQVSSKAIPIFQALHPDAQAVFIFDCSSAHGAYGPSALRFQNMNLNPGGKQSWLCDTTIPYEDPLIPPHLRGQIQTFCYDPSNPDPTKAGQPKGVRAILQERGLWQHYTQERQRLRKHALKFKCNSCSQFSIQKDAIKRSSHLIKEAEAHGYFLLESQCVREALSDNQLDDERETNDPPENPDNNNSCCWAKIMSLQSDFVNERPLLQATIEEAGHVCLFLPKFHCKLNPIELFWS